MTAPLRPIYLLADSELLFRPGEDGRTLPATIADHLETDAPAAAYIGASNGDEPAFYEIFVAAMQSAGIEQMRMIKSAYSAMDHTCLSGADVILLAGGDVRRGWDVITSTGMRDVIVDRYLGGAVVIGVSAGAVQLGRKGFDADATAPNRAFDTLGLAPFVIDAHDEAADWPQLRHLVSATAGERGVGIPHGAGLVCHPDHTFEPLRRPLIELHHGDDGITETLLMPDAAGT